MKITDHNEQRMTIKSLLGGRFIGAIAFLCAIGWTIGIQFIPILEMRVLLSVVGLIVICLVLGSVTLNIIIDRTTQTVTINSTSFFLFNRQSIIPFSDVRGVHIHSAKETGKASNGQLNDSKWRVSIGLYKLDESTDKEKIVHLANEISQFIGTELVDKSTET